MKDSRILLLVLGMGLAVTHPQWTSAAAARDAGTGQPPPAAERELTSQSEGKAIPLSVTSDVSHQVCIQAVLIPADVGRRIFGKEVADHYAVVELIICNEDTKASLIVQSIFLDYSEWLLSGNGLAAEHPLQLSPNETATKKSQVASVESRLVRGELLDAQQWTARNWTMRTLTALGSVAVGYAFPFSTDVNKGFSAFNGVVIPAAQNLWPDGTIPQVNRISDVGFQTNKVIGPKHADVVVAFFPVNRFLTKGFQKEFLRNTAAWFVPKEMVADPKTVKEFEMFAGPLARQIDQRLTPANFQGAMLNAMLARCKGVDRNKGDETAHQCRLQDLLDGVSLNRIRVVLHGIMTVDEQTIPASIQSVEFKAGRDPSIWTKTGADQAGFVKGMYLTGGTVSLVDANGDSIDGVTTATVAEGSTDERLNFTMNISECVSSSTKVFLVVKKQAKPQEEVEEGVSSALFELLVQPATNCQPTADAGQPSGQTAEQTPASGQSPGIGRPEAPVQAPAGRPNPGVQPPAAGAAPEPPAPLAGMGSIRASFAKPAGRTEHR